MKKDTLIKSCLLIFFINEFNRYLNLVLNQRNINFQDILIAPKLNNISFEDNNKVIKKEYLECLSKFKNTLENKFTKEELTYFYHNFKTLEIKQMSKNWLDIFSNSIKQGQYNIEDNLLQIEEKTYKRAIYHELFHMASSYTTENTIYSGFYQTTSKTTLAIGINEGYTELLNEKYFIINDYLNYAYSYEKKIAQLLEIIVGNKMEKLYLNANLVGLINELRRYTSLNSILQFIKDTDFIYYYLDKEYLNPLERKTIESNLQYISKFLIICYAKKLKKLYNKKIINRQELANNLQTFLLKIPASVNSPNKNYLGIDDDIIKCLNKIFSDITKYDKLNKKLNKKLI